ncbi:histone-lysine N-methyltransferase PRDM9-like [Ornithodoros turicata]|uniref:histone-lysine N-methyltransferase PRDM9-like n=1 Tax=Ornithodoros turicata TaxID=34597 RepID=UPI003139F72A
MGTPCRADLTFPEGLVLGRSSIPGAQRGVYTMVGLPKRTCFGPFEGVVVADTSKGTSYTWEICSRGRRYLVDARPLSLSNWMRYVNCANSEAEQNLVAFQYKGSIYYRTYKNASPGTELLVWCGTEFARELGIVTSRSQGEVNEEDNGNKEGCRGSVFKCTLCGSLFASEEYLNRHNTAKHPSKGIKHRCTFCDYSSDKTNNVKAHERTHTGEKPYVCPLCCKGFAQKGNMETHWKKLHAREREYECSTCGRAFAQKVHLQNHEKVHTRERPYVCGHCDKTFTVRGNLTRHLRIHAGKMFYQCDRCGYGFADHSALKRHTVSVHTKDFPHRCGSCRQGFRCPAELRKHMQKRHPFL